MKKILTLLLAFLFCGFVAKAQNCQVSFLTSLNSNNASTINFTGTSSVNSSSGVYISFSWNFGDGTQGFGMNQTHNYVQAGTYVACVDLVVIDSTNNTTCTDTYCDSVIVTFNCNANINVNANWATPATFDFYGLSNSNYPNTTANYSWNFGDGNTTTGSATNHTYSQPGTYGVCLTVDYVDSSGLVICSAWHCDTVFADTSINCQTTFAHYANQFNQYQISFQNTSINLHHSNQTSAWDFGDGNSTNTGWPSANHTYSQPGTYIACVTRTVIDSISGNSCTSTYCDTVVINSINPNPQFCDAFYDVDSLNSTVTNITLINYSIPLNSSQYITTYSWDFGDGSSSTLPYPIHNYANAGLYSVCLTITSVNNALDTCSDTYCRTVGVDSLGNLYFKKGTVGFTLNVVAPSIGIDEEALPSVKLYPNPATNKVMVDLGTQIGEDASWVLYDLKGVLIGQGAISDALTNIDISQFNNGMYILKVEHATSVSTHKLQITK